MKIEKEQKFAIPGDSFAVSPSNEGYTLAYSVDGETFTPYDKVTPAGENMLISGLPCGLYYKLLGNNSTVYIKY